MDCVCNAPFGHVHSSSSCFGVVTSLLVELVELHCCVYLRNCGRSSRVQVCAGAEVHTQL